MLSQKYFSEKFIPFLQKEQNPPLTFLLAVSGGVDSMVLLHLFQNFNLENDKLKFEVAHINYKLRGIDSDLDQNLVENFCQKYHIPFHLYEVSEKDQKPEGSIQLWARNLRYDFFRKIQKEKNLDYLVTAHHLNDQLETFFINLSRGSGIDGLSGIPSDERKILRPLLNFSKNEIYTFAKEQNILFREDISNQKNDYLRNQFRNIIIPEIMKICPNFLDNFLKSIDILQESKNFINQQIHDISKHEILLNSDENGFVFDKAKLAQESDFVKFNILQDLGVQNKTEIDKIFTAETGKTFHTKKGKISIDRDKIIFRFAESSVNESVSPKEITLQNTDNEIIIKDYFLTQKEVKTNLWLINHEKISLPLKLRHLNSGDIFYPIGMNGKKKISKFLKDEKISILEREKVWLLCDANDEILGVLPLRQDRRFMTENENSAIKIRF